MGTELKPKILFSGDVEGKFDTLFKRVNSIMKKSGKFEMLLCVGNFFGTNNEEFEAYRSGSKKVPLPIYVLGPNIKDHENLYPTDDAELCPNVYYLGRRGLFINKEGLKIAYISGMGSLSSGERFNYDKNDIIELFDLCLRSNVTFRGVDILLCSQWPNGIVVPSQNDEFKPLFSSDLPSLLILKLKPRYVVCGLEGKYYERPPFRIPSLGDQDPTVELSSRFIGLARVDNPNKEKWIYALNLTPIEKVKLSELMQKTTDETVCPFDYDNLQNKIFNIKKSDDRKKQYFYDTALPLDEPSKKKLKREKIQFDQEKCWFCLASPSVEKHLIVTVGDHSYVALAKGGVIEEHFLICPIQHFQNSLNAPDTVKAEIGKFKRAIDEFYGRNGNVPVFFERNYKTSHMQLQAIPVPKQATNELRKIFIEEAEANGLILDTLDSDDRLDQVLLPNAPFFIAELPDKSTLYTRIKGNFPINFGREVVCTDAILNLPDKIDWKECILSKEKEEKLVKRIRNDFDKYDFNTL